MRQRPLVLFVATLLLAGCVGTSSPQSDAQGPLNGSGVGTGPGSAPDGRNDSGDGTSQPVRIDAGTSVYIAVGATDEPERLEAIGQRLVQRFDAPASNSLIGGPVEGEISLVVAASNRTVHERIRNSSLNLRITESTTFNRSD